MFLGVTELVQGPEGGVPSFVWLEAPKQRYDFRREVIADAPSFNIEIEGGQVRTEWEIGGFGIGALPPSNCASVADLIENGPQIIGRVEQDAGENVGELSREFDFVDILARLRLLIDEVGPRAIFASAPEGVDNAAEVVDVMLCTRESQARTREHVSHDNQIRSDERAGVPASIEESAERAAQAPLKNENRAPRQIADQEARSKTEIDRKFTRQFRSGLCPAPVSRAAFVTIVGPQGYLYSVDILVPNEHPDIEPQDFLSANRANILFALGARFLWLAHLAILAQAKNRLRSRSRDQ
jgi:hypothetical protein